MAKKKNEHIVTDIQKYFLLTVLILLIITLFIFVSDFLGTMFVAAVIVAAVYPVHQLLMSRARFPKTLSAVVTLILIAALIVAPLTYFFFAIVRQATGAYSSISSYINDFIAADFSITPMLEDYPEVQKWFEDFLQYTPITADSIVSAVGDFIGSITSILVEQTTNVLKKATVILLHAIVFILAMYFFIRDGEAITEYVKSMIPLSEEYREELIKKIKALMHAVVFGIFGAAIVQGILVWLGFTLVGVSNAAFWGALAAMFSPVPYVGPTVVWFPVVLMFFFSGQWMTGIFLFIWGTFVVGLSDNFIKPIVIGSGARLHPFGVLVVILGGVFAFGFQGLIFGPLILTLTLAFLHIYKLEYAPVLAGKGLPIRIKKRPLKKKQRRAMKRRK
jgi:predicted PurR-regulated permease PerM